MKFTWTKYKILHLSNNFNYSPLKRVSKTHLLDVIQKMILCAGAIKRQSVDRSTRYSLNLALIYKMYNLCKPAPTTTTTNYESRKKQ